MYQEVNKEGSFRGVFPARKYFKGECAGKPDAASASGKKGGWSDYSGSMTKPYIEQIEKEGSVCQYPYQTCR